MRENNVIVILQFVCIWPVWVRVSSYPDLKFDPLILTEDGLDFEVDADGWDESRREGIIGITEEKRRFADTAIPDDQQFKHVIEILVSRILLPPVVLAYRHVFVNVYSGGGVAGWIS